jgi:hypothetical protein
MLLPALLGPTRAMHFAVLDTGGLPFSLDAAVPTREILYLEEGHLTSPHAGVNDDGLLITWKGPRR